MTVFGAEGVGRRGGWGGWGGGGAEIERGRESVLNEDIDFLYLSVYLCKSTHLFVVLASFSLH